MAERNLRSLRDLKGKRKPKRIKKADLDRHLHNVVEGMEALSSTLSPTEKFGLQSAITTKLASQTATDEEIYLKDISIECPGKTCKASVGKPCEGLEGHLVHFSRRLKRLLNEMNANRGIPRKL